MACLNPYALLCGLLSGRHVGDARRRLAAGLKTTGPVAERARRYGSLGPPLATLMLYRAGRDVALAVVGRAVDSVTSADANPTGPSNPTASRRQHMTARRLVSPTMQHGHAMDGECTGARPWLGAACWRLVGLRAQREVAALLASKLSIFGIMLQRRPSRCSRSSCPRHSSLHASLTVWDAVVEPPPRCSHMPVASAIFLPIIFAHTAWVYKVLWGKVDEKTVTDIRGPYY